jgi:hypothetical protein
VRGVFQGVAEFNLCSAILEHGIQQSHCIRLIAKINFNEIFELFLQESANVRPVTLENYVKMYAILENMVEIVNKVVIVSTRILKTAIMLLDSVNVELLFKVYFSYYYGIVVKSFFKIFRLFKRCQMRNYMPERILR